MSYNSAGAGALPPLVRFDAVAPRVTNATARSARRTFQLRNLVHLDVMLPLLGVLLVLLVLVAWTS